jgi:malate dehydrogenase (oxaloacetate-decarboxylating)
VKRFRRGATTGSATPAEATPEEEPAGEQGEETFTAEMPEPAAAESEAGEPEPEPDDVALDTDQSATSETVESAAASAAVAASAQEPAPDDEEPESVEPESVETESVETESFEPGSFEPGSFEPGSFEPGSFEPGSFEPGSFEPGSFETESETLESVAAAALGSEAGSAVPGGVTLAALAGDLAVASSPSSTDEPATAPVTAKPRPGGQLPEREAPTAAQLEASGRARGRWVAPDGAWETTLRGRQVMNDPRLYRGVAFTEAERRSLGLVGLLPPQVVPLHEQLTRALGQYYAQPTALAKHVYLSLLQDRNEVLFFRLLSEHLPEMLPVVYTPTVGEAIQHYSQEYRRPRGVFLSVDRPEDIELSLTATRLGADDVDLVVATDGEAILGIGDWGVGGIGISLGKLALYTAAGGIDPGRAIAVMLDVGTNRQSLLDDPLYLGNRHPRVDEQTYDAFIDTFVETVTRLFPSALLHWEDLAARNARRILHRWRDDAFTFNDDVQGTGAVALAAVLSGLRRSGGHLAEQRVVIFGAGTAGVGIAEQLRDAMVADGLDAEAARHRFWLVDRNGLLVESLGAAMGEFQRPWARRDEEVFDWSPEDDGRIGLNEVVRHAGPTVLVGTSGQPGAFTENIIRNMALSCQHPIILPLSNPTDLVEAEPWDILQWTGGRALVATGSAFDPVTYAWSTHYIGQANNALVFPGLGLGATLVGAVRVTDHMLTAAAEAISAQVDMTIAGAALLPEIDSLHATSAAVALAVAEAALDDGVARWALPEQASAAVEAAMWRPQYRQIRAV